MKASNECILTINGGSSSIKFAIFEVSLMQIVRGEIERIGSKEATLHINSSSHLVNAPDQSAAVNILIDLIKERTKSNRLIAIGHRIVHGGPKYSKPERIHPKMLAELEQLSAFDPEHLPQETFLAKALYKEFPDAVHIACFDTNFHHELPRVAKILPIPRRYEAKGIRRYGFHGLSYEFLMEELTKLSGAKIAQGRVVLAHLGNGASLAAVYKGKSIDTSMSFTPTAGVPMSTRSGDLDPGLFWYLARTESFDAKEFNDLVNFKSGLLGISETSSDMRDLLNLETNDERAAEAILLFCYQIKKCIGAFAAALSGLDILVFSGGIGENCPKVRALICEGLGFLGIEIEEKKNIANANLISTKASKVAVHVIHTDEESMIAKSVCHILEASR